MSLFVDTSVWSLALRRDASASDPAVAVLSDALIHGRDVLTTGLVLQELLQGFRGPKAREAIVERFQHLPLLVRLGLALAAFSSLSSPTRRARRDVR